MHIQACASAMHHVHKILLRRGAEDTRKFNNFRSRALGLKTPRQHCVVRTKKIRVPATFTVGFMDTIRMVGLASAQPANGRIRPLAPIFMPRYAAPPHGPFTAHERSALFSAAASSLPAGLRALKTVLGLQTSYSCAAHQPCVGRTFLMLQGECAGFFQRRCLRCRRRHVGAGS
jgi:hypothetical protein